MGERLTVGDLDVRVEIVPSRRTVRLTVERDATVTAQVPAPIDPDVLTKVIRDRSQWLYGKLAAREADADARPRKEFVNGEGFRYLGRNHRLELTDDSAHDVRLVHGRLLLLRTARPTEALVAWYRRAGQRWLPPRAAAWARTMGLEPPRIAVRPLGYRWGSCGTGGTLNFHWAVMQLPADLVDHVIVHELVHLVHRGHTPAFWRTVELAQPGAEHRRKLLRDAGASLWLPADPPW
ncbi:M48 family metallopeptidase [Actinomadura flavalba]|uniref:M48 family metallopeptidase n=1 Tax=Actinomadura flavalba TaxID=1120938 RepID=UPI00036FB4E1|nr:SprT family zinc-dependent metalloprotease [Actinomadura flavalba]